MSDLTTAVQTDFTRYFRHLGQRVERAVRAVPLDRIWIKPFPFGNSVGHVVLHLTGNLNHYIGSLVAGTGYVRNRPFEFTDPTAHPPNVVLDRFREAIELVCRTIETMDAESFCESVSEQPPVQSRFGLFLVCAAHLNNHIGQLAYLVRAHGHDTGEPPLW